MHIDLDYMHVSTKFQNNRTRNTQVIRVKVLHTFKQRSLLGPMRCALQGIY